jgi:hypothetical protein
MDARDFEMDLSKLNPNNNSHVNSTIAKPIICYDVQPLQMADLPELQPLLMLFNSSKT